MRPLIVKRIGVRLCWVCIGLLILFLLTATVSIDFVGDRARPVVAKAQIAAFRVALKRYHSDVGEYPTEEQGLQALRVDPGVPGWKGPYLSLDIPKDPWSVPYGYFPGANGPRIVSLGGGIAHGERAISVGDDPQ